MSAWESRPPAEIQMGNGTLLATFDALGEIEQLFGPHIDALGCRIGAFRTAVLLPGNGHDPSPMIPLVADNWETRVRLLSGSQVLQVEYQHRNSPLRLMRTLGLHPTDAVILDSWESPEPIGLVHQSIPWMGNATSAHCSLFHPTLNGMVHHRGRRWLGILARGPIQWVRVGHLSDDSKHRLWDGERIHAPVGPSEIGSYPKSGNVQAGWDQVVQGPATWGAFVTAPERKIEFMIICGDSERHLTELKRQVEHVETGRYLQMIDGMSARRHAPASEMLDRISNPRIRSLAERSIDVLHALQDARSGALMAAAEVDPHSKVSGGYGFSWPRDGAYLSAALGAFGFRERVEHYFRFLQDTQDPSGTWWQRYAATGHAGPSWGRIQIDEPATVISAAYVHYRRTQDLFWLEKIWPCLEKGLEFLQEFHGPEHPLGLPSHDLWEERMGIHAYSLGAVASAFGSAAYMAGELSHTQAQTRYQEWQKALTEMISEKFISEHGPIRRSLVTGSWDYKGHWDETPDVSLLGLINPFGVFHRRDVVATRIVDSVRKNLWSRPVGGVIRYTQDTYRGGNPWVLTTLWLGMIELSLKNYAEAKECLDWAVNKSTGLGMLAEQIHKESGKPCWVIPLGWSHAMFLLFVREVIDRKAEAEIWGAAG